MPFDFISESAGLPSNTQFFSLSSFLWGMGFAIVSVFFVAITWGLAKQNLKNTPLQAIIIWLFDLVLLVVGGWFLTRAFPRVHPGLVLAIFILVIVSVAGGGAIQVQKKKSGGEETGAKKPEK